MDDQVLQPDDYGIFIPRRLEAYVQTAIALTREPRVEWVEPRFIVINGNQEERQLLHQGLRRQLFHHGYCPYRLSRVVIVNRDNGMVLETIEADDYFSLVEQWEAEHGSPTS